LIGTFAVALGVSAAEAQSDASAPTGVAAMRKEAEALRPLVKSSLAGGFLDAVADLPAVAARTIYRDPKTGAYRTEAAANALGEEERKALVPLPVSERVYYYTKYGTPLAYVRPLEVLGENGLKDVRGKRVLDFGYGTIGHLRLLASLGADAVGVDVDSLLAALYGGPDDTGKVRGRAGRDGSVTLIDGRFPADEKVNKAVGGGYDLIVSKNTLKNGYLHPAQPVDKRMLVDLGVSDEAFVKALYAALKPGGRVLIYNLSPAPSPPGQPYKPWTDGRCPFPRSVWESAGFKVQAFDANDDTAARAMGRALGWDKGPSAMDLDKDLLALYTLVERP
jgi:SAM-dependent methyltransferase